MALTFGNVPKPKMIEAICAKPYDGAGYDSCPPRHIVGLCIHIWDGHLQGATDAAKIQYAHNFFSTGGDRQFDALVDFVITKGGTIGMLNDPFGTRRPWANGWGDEGPGLEGDGPAFVDAYGTYGTNFNLASCEHEGVCGDKLTDAQLESSAQLHAWLFDHDKVPWDSFPVNPASGVVTNLWHSEFAKKDCPCQAIRDQTPALQERVKAIMQAAQEQAPVIYEKPYWIPHVDGLDHADFKACKRTVTVKRGGGAECYTRASKAMPRSGPNLFGPQSVVYIVKANDGSRWYVHEQGHRMPMAHFAETFSTNLWTA
jgi:hypothetical protein